MWFGILTLATALIISISAAYYSILGLTAIFAAAFWPIVILGSSLEVGKIVSTLWLHKYWSRAELQYKVYLCSAVAILMLLTSMGVFGFLSKAHSDQSLVSGDVIAKISIYDEKIKQARDNITTARSALQQMDVAVDQTMSRSTTEQGADKAAQLRRSQNAERTRLLREIEAEQKKIQALNDERAPIAAEVRKVEAEVGPIKYIAALIYGDNPEANVLEKAVRWVIILIVIVFDPLALTLLLAATKTLEWERGVNILAPTGRRSSDEDLTEEELKQINDQLKEAQEDPEATEFFDQARNVARAIDEDRYIPPAMFGTSHLAGHNPEPVKEDLDDTDEIDNTVDSLEKIAKTNWKAAHPDKTIKRYRKLYEQGSIDDLPWNSPEFRPDFQEQLAPVPDNMPTGQAGEVKGFGTDFPSAASKGDMFLRVDQLPSKLYKFNGNVWIEVDKKLVDNYAYDDAYIAHLIEKIGNGEYDPDLLSDVERESIEEKLRKL